MSNTTVFDSTMMEELKKILERLEKFKVEEGLLAKALSFVGRASVSEEAVTAHNKLIDETIKSYTFQMNELLTLTEQMKKDNDNNNVRMKSMSDYITKLKLSLAAQKQHIQISHAAIDIYNKTIERLKRDNASIQEAKDALTTQNEKQNTTNQKLTAQKAEQQQQNKTLTAQNESQQQQISGMKENLAHLIRTLAKQTEKIRTQTEKINQITNSNADLKSKLEELEATQRETENKGKIAAAEFEKIKKAQDAHIKDINAAQKIKVLFLKNSAKNKLKRQRKVFIDRIAEIKENSNKSIKDKEAEINRIKTEHTKAQNEINTELINLQVTSKATIADLKGELGNIETEKKLLDDTQGHTLNTVTRVFPLSWNNSKGFNIGNITTQVRGTKPYHANDTIDYYLHTLFKGETPIGEPRDIISSKQVPIRGIHKETSGGKKNRMKKSKKSNKSKNNKTKKQRKH